MKITLRVVAIAAFLAFAAAQIAAGYSGIEVGVSAIWAWVAVFAALLLRFTLPVSIGAFYGAVHVWGWHWAAALLFALPGLVFMLPGVIPAIFSMASTSTAKLTRATPICAEH